MKIPRLGRLTLRHSAPMACMIGLAALSNPSARTGQRPGGVASEVTTWMAAYGAETVTIDRNARDFKLPDQIPWNRPDENGNQTANLWGDPSKPGLYVQLLKRVPNNWSRPHSHPNDRFLTILSGTMWIGTGTKFDRDQTVAIKPGGFVRDIANQPHFDGTKEDGVTIEIVGMGPAGSPPGTAK